MMVKLLNDADGLRTFAVVLETGDEVMACLTAVAAEHGLTGAHLTALGALSGVTLRYFEWEEKAYRDIPLDEQVEVASLVGDIGVGPDGAPALHVHLVVGRRDGSAMAGHLKEAHVRPTLETVITETPRHLHRVADAETGLNLIEL